MEKKGGVHGKKKGCQFSALCFAFRHTPTYLFLLFSCLGSCLVGVVNVFKKPLLLLIIFFCVLLFLSSTVYRELEGWSAVAGPCEVVVREIAMFGRELGFDVGKTLPGGTLALETISKGECGHGTGDAKRTRRPNLLRRTHLRVSSRMVETNTTK